MVFLDTGYIPKTFPEKVWITDYIFIQEGYSKADIEVMEEEEYDYMLEFLLEKQKKKGPKTLFDGGI